MRDQTRLLPINTYHDNKRIGYQAIGQEIYIRKFDGREISNDARGFTTVGSIQGMINDFVNWSVSIEPSDSSLENECVIKTLLKLADQKVNMPVTVAEAAKTQKLILDKANQVYRFLRDVRRGRLGSALHQLGLTSSAKKFRKPKASESLDKLSTAWLEYKYGWMPLLMDIHGAAEAIVDRMYNGRLPWVAATSRVLAITPGYQRYTSGYSVGSYSEYSVRSEKTFRVKIEADISTPHLNQAQQLGLTNPALVAWELVPFSFVFDWFVSVGDYLAAATALQGIQVRRAFVSRLKHMGGTYWLDNKPYENATYRISGWTNKLDLTDRDYYRRPLDVNPLFLYPPVDRDPLKFQRLLSGLALLKGNARGLRV